MVLPHLLLTLTYLLFSFVCLFFVLLLCSDEHSGKVKSFMLDVLCPLITESDTISNELLDIILINLVEPNKTQRKNAFGLAKELVAKTSDTLEPYIQAVSLLLLHPLPGSALLTSDLL